MTSSFTTNAHLEKPANGDFVDDWDVPVNADWDAIDAVFGNNTLFNVVAVSGTVTLTVTQYRPRIFKFSGLLTANINYQLPTGIGGQWVLINATTGAFTLTFSSAGGGTAVVFPQSSITNVLCDGTNVIVGAAASGANADITSLKALGLTGVVKGTGANNPLIAATAGTDYVAPTVGTVFSATQIFSGSAAAIALDLVNAAEVATLSATPASGTITYDLAGGSILIFTSNASGNWTMNLTFSSTPTTLNTAMATGQCMTCVFMATQGATPFYNNVVQVDGTVTGVTTIWQGGAPIAGNASGVDVYTFAIIKTAAATFTVLATLTQFK